MPAQRTVRTSWHARNAFSPRSERFLTKLFDIASDPSFALSIRWDSSGKSIILHHLPELAEICKTRFNCTTLESFEGNFRRYGFKSRRESPNGTMITTWTHPVLNRFYRGDLELISRKEAKNPYSLTESESRSKSELECQSYSSSECQPRAADIYIDHVDICFLQILYRIASTQKNKNIIYWETNTSPSRMVLRNLEKLPVLVKVLGCCSVEGFYATLKRCGFEITSKLCRTTTKILKVEYLTHPTFTHSYPIEQCCLCNLTTGTAEWIFYKDYLYCQNCGLLVHAHGRARAAGRVGAKI